MTALRWEWRTFGAELDGAEARLTGLPPVRVDDSEELYILSSRVEGSIKVRDGKLDVKRLERVSEDGLEQWNPVAKAEFPIAATDVASLLAALDVSVPSLHHERYALDQLVADVVEPHDDLVAVPPQVNVVASAIFMVAVLVMIGNVLWGLRARRARESMPAAIPMPEPLPRTEAA